jgi:uncharacterized protein YjiS (DUF1127 family)
MLTAASQSLTKGQASQSLTKGQASQSLTKGQYVQSSLTARGIAAAHSAVRVWRLWHARRRQRQALAHIDERDLSDLGLSRWDIERELNKPFWHDCLNGRISPLQ